MDYAEIIHMNGRIYDPTLGRFLQADPHIQAPMNSQNYNRYSYVLNNPMSYTDPSGYFFSKLNKMFGKFAPFVSIAAMIFIPGAWGFATESILGAVTTGFFAGGIATGSLKGAVTGAFAAAAFYGIGQHFSDVSKLNLKAVSDAQSMGLERFADELDSELIKFGGNSLKSIEIAQQIVSHAAVGGVTSVLGGGKFGHGFLAAGVTKGLGGALLPGGNNLSGQEIAGGSVVSAVIGGTASVISGGKFENGARTAAYQYLFNQVKDSIRSIAQKRRILLIAKASLLNKGSSVGHVFLGFPDHTAGAEAWGFYPSEGSFINAISSDGVVLSDLDLMNRALGGDEMFSVSEFTVDQATYERVYNSITAYGSVNDYSLLYNSCGTAAYNSLANGGLPIPLMNTWVVPDVLFPLNGSN